MTSLGHPIFTLGRVVREKLSGMLELQGGGTSTSMRFKSGNRSPEASETSDTDLLSCFASIFNANDAKAIFSSHDVGSTDSGALGERTLITACEALTLDTIFRVQPTFSEDLAGLSLPPAYHKEIPPLPITPEELGLVKVVLHNTTLKDVLGASFLGKERILRLLFAYQLLGWVRIQGERDRALDQLVVSLSKDQRELRESIFDWHTRFDRENFFEWLSLPPYTGNQEIQSVTQKRIELCVSPATEKLFLADERGVLRSIVSKTEEVRNVLTHATKRAEYAAFAEKGGKGSFLAQNQEIRGLDVVAQAFRLEQQGQKDAAVAAYENHLRSFPDQVDTLSAYSIALLRMYGPTVSNHQKRALSLLKILLEKHPQHPSTYISSIEWLRATQQKAKTFEFAKKAFSMHPAHPYFRTELIQGGHDLGPSTVVELLYPVREKMNHYQILGLTPQSSPDDIRSSYRTLSKALHPDRFFQSTDETLKSKAKDLYKRVVSAHSTLKDPAQRREYDQITFTR